MGAFDTDIIRHFVGVGDNSGGPSSHREEFLREQECKVEVLKGVKPLKRLFLYFYKF